MFHDRSWPHFFGLSNLNSCSSKRSAFPSVATERDRSILKAVSVIFPWKLFSDEWSSVVFESILGLTNFIFLLLDSRSVQKRNIFSWDNGWWVFLTIGGIVVVVFDCMSLLLILSVCVICATNQMNFRKFYLNFYIINICSNFTHENIFCGMIWYFGWT